MIYYGYILMVNRFPLDNNIFETTTYADTIL